MLATAMIEPPDWLLLAYREGRCRGMNELYELRRLHGEHGDVVENWAAQEPSLTRDRIVVMRAELDTRASQATATTPLAATTGISADTAEGVAEAPCMRREATSSQAHAEPRQHPAGSPSRSEQRVHVEFEGHDYQLVVCVVPDQAGCMYVRPLTGGPRRLAPVASLKLLGLVGG